MRRSSFSAPASFPQVVFQSLERLQSPRLRQACLSGQKKGSASAPRPAAARISFKAFHLARCQSRKGGNPPSGDTLDFFGPILSMRLRLSLCAGGAEATVADGFALADGDVGAGGVCADGFIVAAGVFSAGDALDGPPGG